MHFALPQDITYPPDQILTAFRRFRSGSCLNDVAASSFHMTFNLVMATSTIAHACKVYASGQFRHCHHLHCACRLNISNTWICHLNLCSWQIGVTLWIWLTFNLPWQLSAKLSFQLPIACSVGMQLYLMATVQQWYHGLGQLWTWYW